MGVCVCVCVLLVPGKEFTAALADCNTTILVQVGDPSNLQDGMRYIVNGFVHAQPGFAAGYAEEMGGVM